MWLGVAKSISDRSIEGQSPSLEVLNPRGASPDRDFGQFCSPELAHHQPLSTNRKEFLPSCPPGPSLAFTPTLTSSSSSSTAIPGGSQGPGAAPKTKFSISAFFCSPPSAALSLPLSFHPGTLPFAHALAALHGPAPKRPPCDSSLLALLTPPKKISIFPPHAASLSHWLQAQSWRSHLQLSTRARTAPETRKSHCWDRPAATGTWWGQACPQASASPQFAPLLLATVGQNPEEGKGFPHPALTPPQGHVAGDFGPPWAPIAPRDNGRGHPSNSSWQR